MELENRISKKALKVWRISGIIKSVIGWIIVAFVYFLMQFFHWLIWVTFIAGGLGLIFSFLDIYLFPLLRWKYWRYEVREEEIELQGGVIIKRRTLIPMVRVQHVDTVQGPIYRTYHLASVIVHTAATVHEIPALEEKEADRLRISISKLARVSDEDV
ncbi:MAG: PH domain-containing protein [Bacillota bacterium]|nr:PH domain-containing protein [Bacillota bacterium]